MRISDWSSDVCSSDLSSFQAPRTSFTASILRVATSFLPPCYGNGATAMRPARQRRLTRAIQAVRPDSRTPEKILLATRWRVGTRFAYGVLFALSVGGCQCIHHCSPKERRTHAISSVERSDEHTSELQTLILL